MAITDPIYATGRDVWKLGFRGALSPSDKRFVQGQVGVVSFTGTGTGRFKVVSGGPTDSFQIVIVTPNAGDPDDGVATYKYSLDGGTTFSLVMPLPGPSFELPETGLFVQFIPGLSPSFHANDQFTLSTVISPQVQEMIAAVSSRMARFLRPREGMPLRNFGTDLRLLCSQIVADELLSVGGYDPNSQFDRQVQARAKQARVELDNIMEEIEQADLEEGGHTDGVRCHSQQPQGVGLW